MREASDTYKHTHVQNACGEHVGDERERSVCAVGRSVSFDIISD